MRNFKKTFEKNSWGLRQWRL